MFADRAKIYIRSGKGGSLTELKYISDPARAVTGTAASGENSTCPTADRTAVTAAGAVI